MTIINLLKDNAEQRGDKICLMENNCVYTWREFDEHSNKLANWLIAKGITKGHKVAILIKNCIDWLPIYFGVLKSGAIAVPINYNFDVNEISYCIKLIDCSVIIYADDFTNEVEMLRQDLKKHLLLISFGSKNFNHAISYSSIILNCSVYKPDINISADDYAAIYFSSGTTGLPKAVLLKHKSLYAAAITEQKHHMQTEKDVFLIIAPLYHTGAKIHWFGSLLVGGSAVILNNALPDIILKTISKNKVTIAWLLLPWVQDLIEAVKCGDVLLHNYNLKSWRLMHMGAQPIPSQTITEWHEFFPNMQFDISYGLTEATGPGCVHLGIDNYYKTDSIGLAGFGWEADIMIDDIIALPNIIGELVVKGDGVMAEYYMDPASTEAILHNGWLKTGDMAFKDSEGYLYLVGRKKDIIISGGENIYPVQIENFLRGHDAVKDVAVIGAPSRRLGEVVVAAVELIQGRSCTKTEMHRFCEGLPLYKRPFRFYFTQIPRNSTGKIDKISLKEQLFKSNKML